MQGTSLACGARSKEQNYIHFSYDVPGYSTWTCIHVQYCTVQRRGERSVGVARYVSVRFWMSVSRLFETGCLSVLPT